MLLLCTGFRVRECRQNRQLMQKEKELRNCRAIVPAFFAGLNLLVYARIALAPSSLWCYCRTVQARSSAVNFVVFTG